MADQRKLTDEELFKRLVPREIFHCKCGRGFETWLGLIIHCRANDERHYPENDPTTPINRDRPVVHYDKPVPERDELGRLINHVFILTTVKRYDGLPSDPIPLHPKSYAALRKAKRVGAQSKANPRYERTEYGRWRLVRRGEHRR